MINKDFKKIGIFNNLKKTLEKIQIFIKLYQVFENKLKVFRDALIWIRQIANLLPKLTPHRFF